jgi:ABC-type bacteriocin/lantibiotic exporter with double-glycine peptidase domain
MTAIKNRAWLVFLFFIAECAGSHKPDFLKELKAHPERGYYIPGVPFYPQEESMCGPASLASVMNYYGIETSPQDIASAYFSGSVGGVFPVDLELFAQEEGLEAKSYSGDLENLHQELWKDHPLIIFQNLAFEPVPLRHFAVVVGFYREDDHEWIILYSGKAKDLLMPVKKFLASWQRTGNWTLLVLPRNEAPR